MGGKRSTRALSARGGDAEPFWSAQLAAAAALLCYLTLPHALIMGPKWLALPLTSTAKLLMAVQSLIALATILIVAARAVNVLA
jgi:hypothetical protein